MSRPLPPSGSTHVADTDIVVRTMSHKHKIYKKYTTEKEDVINTVIKIAKSLENLLISLTGTALASLLSYKD